MDLVFKKHLLCSVLKTVVLANIFVETENFFFMMNKTFFKKSHLFEIEIICNNINVFYCHVWSIECIFTISKYEFL